MIDRAEAWDGDAVLAARNRPADSERGDAPSADSTAADDRPADAARTDAVPATPEQRAAAQRRYRDTVDHTYDVARIDAGQQAASQASQEDSRSRGTGAAGAEARSDEAREAEAPDAVDTGAPDAWAEALPGLRAAWEEHEQRYPERAGRFEFRSRWGLGG